MIQLTPEQSQAYFAQRIGFDLRPKSNGQCYTRCPFHDDRHPSFSLNLETLVWACHSACGSGNIFQFEAKWQKERNGNENFQIREAETSIHKVLVELGEVEGEIDPASSDGTESRFVYQDEDESEVFAIVRTDFDGVREKKFSAEHLEKGQWVRGMHGVRRVPYHLPEVTKASTLFLVEGEIKVEALRQLGLTELARDSGWGEDVSIAPTCVPFGAKAEWNREFNRFFVGKRLAIFPDFDDKGREFAERVAGELPDVAAELKIVELPGLPDKGDVVDFIDLHKDGSAKLLLDAVQNAASWVPIKSTRKSVFSLYSIRDAYALPKENVSYLVDGLLPKGGISVLAGKPKDGKSTVSRQLVACVARGDKFLSRSTVEGKAIYLGLEEQFEDVRQHFRDLGVTEDEDRILFCAGPAPAKPLEALANLVKGHSDLKLVIIDPLWKFLRLKSTDEYAPVTLALESLLITARETGVHIMVVHHMRKSESEDTQDAVLGSTAINGGVDTVMLLFNRKGVRTLETRQRRGKGMAETTLIFDEAKRAVSLGVTQEEALKDAAQQRHVEKQQSLSETRERITHDILEAISNTPGNIEPLFMASIKGKKTVKVSVFQSLIADGSIQRIGTGVSGDPFRYYPGITSESTADKGVNPDARVVAN